jgi:ubiquinone/menaquinone biosynthesis C-methylase UbiE
VKQSKAFLESEGDAWLRRNARASASEGFPGSDPLLNEILALPPSDRSEPMKILEIGCSAGARLDWLKDNCGFDCYGVEPSAAAVEVAKRSGLTVHQGTAEQLPFGDAEFDIVMFGFCLYLCDREDLFRIACEADRVLRNPGWLLILDFYSPSSLERAYEHHAGLVSHKMDYRALFSWHPGYTNYSQRVVGHLNHAFTDDPQEWVATSVLRKNTVRSA